VQAKVTKRLSEGLSLDSAFTWQKELNLGVGADTTYLTPAPNLINDVYTGISTSRSPSSAGPLCW
jgi:hypothetical protein